MTLEENIPPEVRRMNYWERISWHRRRIEFEAPAYVLLDSIKEPFSESTDEELKDQLIKVKQRIEIIEGNMKLAESHEFCVAKIRLAYHCTMSRIGTNKLFHLWKAKEYKRKIVAICEAIGVTIKLTELVGECDACPDVLD